MSDENCAKGRMTVGYGDVFRQKEYMKLIFANVINRFGDSIDYVAFTWLVYSLTGSAAWSAIIFGINRVPTIFLQPFAGAMVENWNKKTVMVLNDIIRGVSVSLVAVLFLLHLLNPWILLAFTLVISSAEAFRGPAGTAVLPKILDKECYDFGLSLNSTLTNVIELAGLALAGGIIALFGIHTAIFTDAVTFFGSAVIILFIKTGEDINTYQKINFNEYLDTLKGGIIYLKKNSIIFNFVLLAMVANAILVPLNSLQAPLIKNVLKQGELMLSVLSFGMTAGLGIGSALYPYAAKKLNTRVIVFMGGILLSFYYLVLVLCGYLSYYKLIVYAVCIITSLITGCALSLLISALNVQFMKQVDSEYLARVGAIMSSGCVGAIPVVSFLIGILTKIVSVSVIFYAIGGLSMIFFIILYLKKVRFE
ncbi:MFS transporter [Anaerocolumna sp. MB42-C2]|uniref:MFS transporter n=1 Tax=Anaerocolumna sp. MB42-C2 TaxID=3070997 RepID=UPI0027E0DB02|nr:MFS transporter [Anaerocolumna sp. MB42-C2]WMJ90499.1 MFS transporter [Anaerocolumna sp. MB42-C2]